MKINRRQALLLVLVRHRIKKRKEALEKRKGDFGCREYLRKEKPKGSSTRWCGTPLWFFFPQIFSTPKISFLFSRASLRFLIRCLTKTSNNACLRLIFILAYFSMFTSSIFRSSSECRPQN